MRTMHKLLALILSFVLMLSLTTIANAATYSDANSITHTEQIGLLTELGILGGYPDGSFKPSANVTRAEMAKQIVAIDLGPDFDRLVTSYTSSSKTFKDTAGTWGEAYINYCAAMGYIKGYGDGTFKPDQNVTAMEAAAMLLRVLGYDQLGEYVGKNWNNGIPVMRDAKTAGLDGNLTLVGISTINRDTASTMVHNTLFAETKTFSGYSYRNNGTLAESKYNIGAVSGIITRIETDAVYLDGTKYEGVTTDFLNLGLNGSISVEYNTRTSAGSRIINKNSIKKVVSTEVVIKNEPLSSTYDGTTLSALTTKSNSKYAAQLDSKVTYYMNGSTSTSSAVGTPSIGDTLNLIDSDGNGKVDIVARFQYNIGEVTGYSSNSMVVSNRTISFAKAAGYEDIQNKDIVYYYSSNGHYFFYVADVETGTATSSNSRGYTINGKSHLVSARASSINISLRTNYTFLYDANGCIISVDFKTGNTTYYDDFVLGVSNSRYNSSTLLTSGTVVFESGKSTSIIISGIGAGSGNYQISANDIKDNVYSYEIDEDGYYVLYPVSSGDGWYSFTGGTFKNGSRDTATTSRGTIYLDSSTRMIDAANGTTYTGYANIPAIDNARGWYLIDTDGSTAKEIFIISSSAASTSTGNTNTFYVFSDSFSLTTSGFYYYMAYANGSLQAVQVNGSVHSLIQSKGIGIYTITSGGLDTIVYNATFASYESKWTSVISDNGNTVRLGDGNTRYLNDNTTYAYIDISGHTARALSTYAEAVAVAQGSTLAGQMVVYTTSTGSSQIDQFILISGFTLEHATPTITSTDPHAYGVDGGVIYGDGAKISATITVKATPYTTVVLIDSADNILDTKLVPVAGSIAFTVEAEAGTMATYSLRYILNAQSAEDTASVSYKSAYLLNIAGTLASKVSVAGDVHKIGSKYYVEKNGDMTLTLNTAGTYETDAETDYFYDKGFAIDDATFDYATGATGLSVVKNAEEKSFAATYTWSINDVTDTVTVKVDTITQDFVLPAD